MILNLEDNKKVITEPDVDYSRSFKILLVDFEWDEITAITEASKKLSGPITVFLYGSKDKNSAWCIAQAKQSNSVLLNMVNRGSCETLKGFLLGEPNVYSYGYHDLDHVFHRKVLDTMSWLAVNYEQWHRINKLTEENEEE
jgi:hypothetical protein